MSDALFVVRDGSRRKASPCAFLRHSDDFGFEIEIKQDVASGDVPAFFVPFVEKGEYQISPELALRWVRERIPPSGRQNLGEILNAHGINEYSELALLRSGRGESSLDSFVIEEVDPADIVDGQIVDKAVRRRKELGAEIKARRNGLGMSQRELADEVGIDQAALSRIESGKANITYDLLSAIDNAVADVGAPILCQTSRTLWNERRCRIQSVLGDCAPDLGQTYRRLVNELEKYDEAAESSIADSRIISHCFREIMDSFSIYVDALSLVGMQGQEDAAKKELLNILERQPLSTETPEGVAAISSELYSALAKLQVAHCAGSLTNKQKMCMSVSGVDGSKSAPISAWEKTHSLAMQTAHLPRGHQPRIPTYAEYLEGLNTLENTLETRIGNIYAAKKLLQEQIAKANRVDAAGGFTYPSKSDVQSFVSLLGDGGLRVYAFRELRNPFWLEALKEHGFFKAYSGLDEGSNEPLHPEPFLSLCLKDDQTRVVKLVMDLSREGWSYARSYLIRAAMDLADSDLVPVVGTIFQWAKDGYGVGSYFWWRSSVDALLTRMLKAEDQELVNLGYNLFRQLVHLRKRQIGQYPYIEIESCISDYQYAPFVHNLMSLLSPEKRLMTCRNMLAEYVSALEEKEAQVAPNSELLLRPIVYSLEPAELGCIGFCQKRLVPWIEEYKQAVLDLLESNPGIVTDGFMDQSVLAKRCIIFSLHEHIGRNRVDEIAPFVRNLLSRICQEDSILFGHEYESEVMLLLADYFETAKGSEREHFFDTISERLNGWESEKLADVPPSGTCDIEREKNYMLFAILSSCPMQLLPGRLLETRKRLELEYGEYTGPRQFYKATTVTGPNSPLSDEEIEKRGATDALAWLRDWTPTEQDRFFLVGYDGVSDVLTKVIGRSPAFFSGYLSDLKEQKPIYIYGILNGWRNALEAGLCIPVEDAIGLCACVLAIQDRENLGFVTGFDPGVDGMGEVLRSASSLLLKLLESSDAVLSKAMMHDALICLLELRKCGLENDRRRETWTSVDEWASASLNMLSSISLSGIIRWVSREDAKIEEDIELAFAELNRVLLDPHTSKADAAALALGVPILLSSNRDWMDSRREQLLGENDPSENQKLVLALVVLFFNMDLPKLFFLMPAIRVAILGGMDQYPSERIGVGLGGFAEWLGLRLYQLHLSGEFDADNELLAMWEEAAEPTSIGRVLERLCALVGAGSDVPEVVLHRTQQLWDRLSVRPDAHSGLLRGAFQLMARRAYSPDWLRNAILDEAQAHNVLAEMRAYFDDVCTLASKDPRWGIALLRRVIEDDEEKDALAYGSMPHALIELYRDKYGKNDNDDVRYCMNELGRMGILDLDLI